MRRYLLQKDQILQEKFGTVLEEVMFFNSWMRGYLLQEDQILQDNANF